MDTIFINVYNLTTDDLLICDISWFIYLFTQQIFECWLFVWHNVQKWESKGELNIVPFLKELTVQEKIQISTSSK